jgi:hypothetical protein
MVKPVDPAILSDPRFGNKPIDIPAFRTTIEERVDEFKKLNIAYILYTMWEKSADGEWLRREVLIELRHHHLVRQDNKSHEKANEYTGIARILISSGEVFAEMGKGYFGMTLTGAVFESAKYGLSGVRQKAEDTRVFTLTLLDNNLQRLSMYIQETSTDTQRAQGDCSRAIDGWQRSSESAHTTARSILSQTS